MTARLPDLPHSRHHALRTHMDVGVAPPGDGDALVWSESLGLWVPEDLALLYSGITHDHDADYSALGHNHSHNDLTGLTTGDPHTQYAKKAGDTFAGPVAMSANKITGLGTPTVSTDAATKAYADTKLPLAGGVMSGQLGIGGTPTMPLTVQRTATFTDWIEFKDASGVRQWHISESLSGDFDFTESGVANNRLYLKAGGLVGINRRPTTNALEVDGAASKSAAGDWLANSDARIKADIEPVEGLSLIARLNPVRFRYTDEYLALHPEIADTTYYNFVAQEFAEVFPDAVNESGEYLLNGDEILQLDPHPAWVAAIGAIKELTAKLEEANRRIEALENGT